MGCESHLMKILQVCSYLYPALAYGGPAKAVHDLSKELSKNHSVTIYTGDSWDETRRLRADEKLQSSKNFEVLYFRNILNSIAYRLRLFTCFGMVFNYLRDYKQYDVVHIHDVFIFPQFLIAFFAKFFSVPYVISPHGILDPTRMHKKSTIKKILWPIAQSALQNATAVVAVSNQEADDLKTLGFKNVTTIFNGAPIPQIDPEKKVSNRFNLTKDPKYLTLLYIGKLHPQKGLLELLQAVNMSRTSIKVLVAGPDDGALRSLKTYCSDVGLQHVHFLGLVDDLEKQYLFSIADIFMYPSYAEGFSISILESMSAAVPVIITEGCNFPLVAERQAGFIVKLKNLDKNIAAILNSKNIKRETLKKFGKNARTLVIEQFSISTAAQKHVRLYEKIA